MRTRTRLDLSNTGKASGTLRFRIHKALGLTFENSGMATNFERGLYGKVAAGVKVSWRRKSLVNLTLRQIHDLKNRPWRRTDDCMEFSDLRYLFYVGSSQTAPIASAAASGTPNRIEPLLLRVSLCHRVLQRRHDRIAALRMGCNCSLARSGLPLPNRSVPVSELFQNASDDQIALTCCFAAVAVSGLIMYFSYHVGVFARGIQSRNNTIRIPDQAQIPATESTRSREKAA